MNETMICAVGNVATQPVFRETASGPVARFRLAVTSRYWNRDKAMWADGHTNFFTVWANRQLATNATASLSVGEPVIVQGRLKVRTETREGQQGRTSADLDAVAIGHDLARGTLTLPPCGPALDITRQARPEARQRTPAIDETRSARAREPRSLKRVEAVFVKRLRPAEAADLAEARRASFNTPCRDAERRFHNRAMDVLEEAADTDL
ncbi:Single-stranded DNA-binding protein [Streptomyces hirsutus]